MGVIRVAVIGEHHAGHEPQDAIAPALHHSSAAAGVDCEVEWVATPALDADAGTRLGGFDAVWCAPGSPYLSLDGAIDGIRWAREHDVPFIGTCAGFQHAVIEFARNVLGVKSAQHAEYDPTASDLFIDELLCSLVGQTMSIRLVDEELQRIYGAADATERYYCRFGVNPAHRPALEGAGLLTAGVDARDGDVRIVRVASHPFFLATLFVPQTSSTLERPHPLISAFVQAALKSRAATGR
ncbi:MAG: CTP synthase [Actinobacteria bacterium]|nr:CTP synthase [Actinomycetota bacterium]MBV8958745.1 CTP synthase [Actinomycetota bacterium]MBV9255906.1 CTP synthase [Actinomycetota bacterium]MBV9664926.1 CTP synthase [Actinomycetota bacterium]MBV9933002.1 CTP synthase [Actinomycetota bacterium]